MARLQPHEAETQVAEERAWKCESCEAMLTENEKRHCASCAAYWEDVSNGLFDGDDFDDWPCPTCNGRGVVNPLTAPDWFFCVSTTECPDCDGTGELDA